LRCVPRPRFFSTKSAGTIKKRNGLGMDGSSSGFKVAEINAEIPRKIRLDGLTIKVLSGAILTFLAGIALIVWIAYGILTGLHTRNMLRRDGQFVFGEIAKTSVNRGGEDGGIRF
jgi:hypothetical protein